MIMLLWLYPSCLLIAVECIFLQWNLVIRYSDVRMLSPASFKISGKFSFTVSLPQCPGRQLKEKFILFLLIVPG